VRLSVTSPNRYLAGGFAAGCVMDALQANQPAAAKVWKSVHTTGITPRPLVSRGRSSG